jgi:hypothetical protein
MANLSQLTLPVKDTITGQVTQQTFNLSGGGGSDTANFVGTLAQWEALTQSEKDAYDFVDLTDDYYDIDEELQSMADDLDAKQDKTDNNLETTSKTVVGAINEVKGSTTDVGNQLKVGSDKFYFDSHDGQYGYNTSAARGADTFVPFKNHAILFMGYFNGSFSGKDETVTCPIDGKLYYVFGGYVTSYAQIWVNGVEQTATANYKNETYGYKSIFEGIDVHKGDTVRRKFSSSGGSAYVDIGIVLG